ncbi:RNA-binding protein 45-like [Biomphalaria glabrata]|uniref:RNA-binding protein 45-like n=2 Tax=Biomphalaria TaxID=6525 RepID=A0A2C9LRD6_BIOGL|nr:RNA-binding protein 45-like [Biomphalaria glabrata]XP_055885046.1 RNA-binding protein 45-like [Biomphalaria glabrata]KAK0044947.1 RNA-binding protein 45 [Biomphalaria pfeifferi]
MLISATGRPISVGQLLNKMAGRDNRDGRDGRDSRGLDDPPNSRLFILCQKGTTEQEFRDAFDKFGTIEDIWIIKDKRTNEDRGIVYIKFSKTSEAMQAMEEMNGRALPGTNKGLKVVVANSKRDGSTRDPREDERLVRLFVIIPKHFSEQTLREEFSKYGDVESVTVLKDRNTGESKGFGYVRYFKPLHAAMAYENCDSSFRPKFAEPQRSRDERDEIENHGFTHHSGAGQKRMYEDELHPPGFFNTEVQAFPSRNFHLGTGPMEILSEYPATNTGSRLIIQAPIGLTQGYLSKLFNIIPGMEYCDLNETTGVAYARYSSPQCAAYARDKLNGFEYPLGSPIHVQMADENVRQEFPMNVDNNNFSHFGNQFGSFPAPGASPMEAIDIRQKAAMILEKAGINPHNLFSFAAAGVGSVGDGRKERVPYCNIPLPPPQPTVAEDGKNLAQRLFIVCQPSGVSERVLKDAFCRFGNLIDVYLLSGRNYGYAKFASKDCAMKAIETLHGQTLAGQKLKVLEAEPPKTHPVHGGMQGDEGPSKKQRL